MNFILSNRLKNYTNDKSKLTVIISIAVMIILALIIVKVNCKFVYKVTFGGETVGYVADKDDFSCTITNKVLNQDNVNIQMVILNDAPKYSLAIVGKNTKTDEDTIVTLLKLKADTTYKLYAITLDGEDKAYVNTLEEAQEKVAELTEKYKDEITSEYGVREVYTDNIIEYKNMKYATVTKYDESVAAAKEEAEKKAAEEKAAAEEEAKKNGACINGSYLTTAPVVGRVSSRYGVNESVRDHTHKGLDIAASNGTPIVAAGDGVVTYAQYNNGGYGNLVKIDHGNGVETYYGHCSKLYVTVGQTVKAGDTIAAVGSTGHSTGNHLHFEIRLNGEYINPQNYFFKGE